MEEREEGDVAGEKEDLLSEAEFEALLVDLFMSDEGRDVLGDPVEVETFGDVRMMTRNKGLVINLQDGSTFQITIVKV